MGAPEDTIERYLVRRCKDEKFICWKMICPSTSGVPDRFIAGYGQSLFVETKRPGGKTRALQNKRIAQMRDAGCRVEIIDSREQVDALIKSLKGAV